MSIENQQTVVPDDGIQDGSNFGRRVGKGNSGNIIPLAEKGQGLGLNGDVIEVKIKEEKPILLPVFKMQIGGRQLRGGTKTLGMEPSDAVGEQEVDHGFGVVVGRGGEAGREDGRGGGAIDDQLEDLAVEGGWRVIPVIEIGGERGQGRREG